MKTRPFPKYLLAITFAVNCAAADLPPGPLTTTENTYKTGRTPSDHPSDSEQLEAHLPRWLRFSGELRERYEGFSGGGYKTATSDNYDLHRLRFGITLLPAAWLEFFGEMQDARVWGRNPALPPYRNTWDLRQAFVQLGKREGPGFTVRVGRQELNFGNGRLIGRSWWTNVSRSFDAVRGSYTYGRYRVDAFASSVVIVRDGVLDHHNQGNNLHGIYGSIKDVLLPGSVVEPYTLWRLQRGVATEEGKPGHLNQFTTGVRALGRLPAHFDYRTEMMVQRGTLGAEKIQAWSGHWLLGYNIGEARTKPHVYLEYNYASGDKHDKDGVTNTFDPIYPTTHDKLGLADQIGWRNIRDAHFGADFRVGKRWVAGTGVHDLWLANAHDALYPTRGAIVARDPSGRSGTHVGEELDFQAIYNATPQTRIAFGYGHVFTGGFLNKTTKGKDYNYPYVMWDYVF